MSAVKRDAAPELYHRAPDCSICGEGVSHDGDSYCCEHCNVYWPDPTGEGEWSNDDTEQCPSTHQPFARNPFAVGNTFQFDAERCLLDEGHESPHRSDSITDWTDETAVNGVGPAATEDGAA